MADLHVSDRVIFTQGWKPAGQAQLSSQQARAWCPDVNAPGGLASACSLCPFVPWKQARGTGARTEGTDKVPHSSGLQGGGAQLQAPSLEHFHGVTWRAGSPACYTPSHLTQAAFSPVLSELYRQCEHDRTAERWLQSCLPLLVCGCAETPSLERGAW